MISSRLSRERLSSTAASDEAWLASYTESTRAAYARALNRYRGWCEAQSVGAEGITIRELERFLAFAASEWGSEPARIASVAIRGRGLVGAEPHRFAPGHRSDRRLDQHRAPVPARERVREASSAAWTLGIVEWALVELLVQTGRSLPQLCRLEGRDLRWCSWAPDGVILIRDLRTKRIVVYGAGEDLYRVLRSLHNGERARHLRGSDGLAAKAIGRSDDAPARDSGGGVRPARSSYRACEPSAGR